MKTMRICSGGQQPHEPKAPDGLCPECRLKAGLGTGVDLGPDMLLKEWPQRDPEAVMAARNGPDGPGLIDWRRRVAGTVIETDAERGLRLMAVAAGVALAAGFLSLAPTQAQVPVLPLTPTEVGQSVEAFQDDFDGTSLKPSWLSVGSDRGIYSVRNGALEVRAAQGDFNHLLLNVPGYSDAAQEVLARLRVRGFGTGDGSRCGLGVAVNPTSGQGINFHFRDDGTRHVRFLNDSVVWGTRGDFPWETDLWYWLRLRHDPTAPAGQPRIAGKVWLADGTVAEPATWWTWAYTSNRRGLAGIAAGSFGEAAAFEVDYILVKAAGLPRIEAAPQAFPPIQPAPPVIVQQPQDQMANEGALVTFSVAVEGSPPFAIQWSKNQAPLVAATNYCYTFAARARDDQAVFQVEVRNALGVVTSRHAVLTVIADRIPPRLFSAVNLSLTNLNVTFSEPVELATATNEHNYALSRAVKVLAAQPGLGATSIVLTTSPLAPGTTYTLTVSEVRDQAEFPNTLAPRSELTFVALEYYPASVGLLIGEVTTDLAMYAPGTAVRVDANLTNRTGAAFRGAIEGSVFHLGHLVARLARQPVSDFAPGARQVLPIYWVPPSTDYQGYLITVVARDAGGRLVDAASVAIDVSSDWAKFPRYGYVARYDAGLNATQVMAQLKNYHLNGIQFYDWQWKHHLPYSPNLTWPDIANRTIYRRTVTNLIAAAHAFKMVAMNYNLYGGAFDSYPSDGSGAQLSMGLFAGARPAGGYTLGNQSYVSLPAGWATAKLYQMNNRDSAWQKYIFAREQAVFDAFAFDGWHIDSLGTHSAYDFSGVYFSLDDHNPAFINNAKTALNRRTLFNTVDAGGEWQIAQFAEVDFVYSELWDGNANYNDFNRRTDNVRKYGSKSVVFAAYLNRGLNSGTFNEPGVRLAEAAMFACGASHIELGDGDKMLHVEYFPNDTSVLMSASLKAAMRAYYDFLVGYENLLRDGTVSAHNAVTVTGAATSTNGSAGTLWLLSKKTLGYNVVHFVNLASNTSALWRDNSGNYRAPAIVSNLPVKMYYSGVLGGGALWFATPDANSGAATRLDFTSGADAGGKFVSFILPRLQYWDMVWLEMNGTTSAGSKIIASGFDSMAGIALEPAADTGGGWDVCGVKNTQGGSYVAFQNVDFGTGASTLAVRAASAVDDGVLEFRLDQPAGPIIASVAVGNTGGWQSWRTFTAPVSAGSGTHNLFAVFKGAPSNLNWFQFGLVTANQTPVISPVDAQAVVGGATLGVNNSVWDPDAAPPQTHTWALLSGPPDASLDPTTGRFTWRSPVSPVWILTNVCLAVWDNGTTPLSATQCFAIAVSPPVRPSIALSRPGNGQLSLTISGDEGPDYILQTSSNLVEWTDAFRTNSPILPFLWTEPEIPASRRFYRVQLAP